MQRSRKLNRRKGRRMERRNGTGVKPQFEAAAPVTIPYEFAKRLREYSGQAPSYADFVDVIGEFIEVRDGQIEENSRGTRIAREVLVALKEARETSKCFFGQSG